MLLKVIPKALVSAVLNIVLYLAGGLHSALVVVNRGFYYFAFR